MARIGRPPGSGTGTNTAPGTCDTCGRAKVFKTDSRRATGGYWTCDHGRTPPPRVRRTGTGTEPATRRTSRRRPRPQGTREWLVNPAVRCCKQEGCYWDAPCPEHGGRQRAKT
jgi:hypothetical protein